MNDKIVDRSRPVAIWLLIGIGMLMIQVVLGGITRLTGSGLSITEWKPIMGVLPPTSTEQWQIAFEKYKQIGQYKFINSDFTLDDFKFIFFWEWFHRLWARLIAVAFAIPFVVFIVQKRFRKDMIAPMLILFLGGALQGAIGWIMVQSGLNENDISVSHYRLAIHFIAAMALICYAVWFALKLLVPPREIVSNNGLRNFTSSLIVLLIVQLIYGAFMAGMKAGVVAPSWPTINGEWIPSQTKGTIFNDPLLVQFIHRMLAYLLFVLVIIWWVRSRAINTGNLFKTYRILPLLLVVLQVVIGIFTVLHSPKRFDLLWLGTIHQFVAMLLLLCLVWMRFMVNGKSFVRAV